MSKKDKEEKKQVNESEELSEEQTASDDSVAIDELEQLKQDLAQLQSKLDSMTGQFQRAVADYHNLEKRYSEGRAELSSWATGELIKKVLPVLDNLERAVEGVSEEERKSGWLKGVEMSVKQLQGILKDEGLGEIEIDGQFDPALHEAVDMREGREDSVLEVVEKGYRLNGKILRPAKVVVGKKG